MKKYLYTLVLALGVVASSTFAAAPAPKNAATFFEIPVSDFDRAVGFYEKILDEKLNIKAGTDYRMAFFPAALGGVAGALTKAGDYNPSASGTVVYLDGGEDLQVILNRVEGAGGKIAVPKMLISPEVGYFAQLIDTEGNRVGLYTPAKRE